MPRVCRNASKNISNAVCVVTTESQPDDQFLSMKHEGKYVATCLSCRMRNNKSKKRWRSGEVSSSGKGVQIRPKDELEIGDEPKYGGEAHERMYKKWLRDLVNDSNAT